jgi:hypothetical protein
MIRDLQIWDQCRGYIYSSNNKINRTAREFRTSNAFQESRFQANEEKTPRFDFEILLILYTKRSCSNRWHKNGLWRHSVTCPGGPMCDNTRSGARGRGEAAEECENFSQAITQYYHFAFKLATRKYTEKKTDRKFWPNTFLPIGV